MLGATRRAVFHKPLVVCGNVTRRTIIQRVLFSSDSLKSGNECQNIDESSIHGNNATNSKSPKLDIASIVDKFPALALENDFNRILGSVNEFDVKEVVNVAIAHSTEMFKNSSPNSYSDFRSISGVNNAFGALVKASFLRPNQFQQIVIDEVINSSNLQRFCGSDIIKAIVKHVGKNSNNNQTNKWKERDLFAKLFANRIAESDPKFIGFDCIEPIKFAFTTYGSEGAVKIINHALKHCINKSRESHSKGRKVVEPLTAILEHLVHEDLYTETISVLNNLKYDIRLTAAEVFNLNFDRLLQRLVREGKRIQSELSSNNSDINVDVHKKKLDGINSVLTTIGTLSFDNEIKSIRFRSGYISELHSANSPLAIPYIEQVLKSQKIILGTHALNILISHYVSSGQFEKAMSLFDVLEWEKAFVYQQYLRAESEDAMNNIISKNSPTFVKETRPFKAIYDSISDDFYFQKSGPITIGIGSANNSQKLTLGVHPSSYMAFTDPLVNKDGVSPKFNNSTILEQCQALLGRIHKDDSLMDPLVVSRLLTILNQNPSPEFAKILFNRVRSRAKITLPSTSEASFANFRYGQPVAKVKSSQKSKSIDFASAIANMDVVESKDTGHKDAKFLERLVAFQSKLGFDVHIYRRDSQLNLDAELKAQFFHDLLVIVRYTREDAALCMKLAYLIVTCAHKPTNNTLQIILTALVANQKYREAIEFYKQLPYWDVRLNETFAHLLVEALIGQRRLKDAVAAVKVLAKSDNRPWNISFVRLIHYILMSTIPHQNLKHGAYDQGEQKLANSVEEAFVAVKELLPILLTKSMGQFYKSTGYLATALAKTSTHHDITALVNSLKEIESSQSHAVQFFLDKALQDHNPSFKVQGFHESVQSYFPPEEVAKMNEFYDLWKRVDDHTADHAYALEDLTGLENKL